MYNNNYFIKLKLKHQIIEVNILGFIIIQIAAIVFLVIALNAYKNIHKTYEKDVEYLPVTVTYTDSYRETYTDAEGHYLISYRNRFEYEVEGVIYQYTAYEQSIRAIRGTQDTWYYNPNHPEQIGRDSSLKAVSGSYKTLFLSMW